MTEHDAAPQPVDDGYPGSTKVLAALAAIFFPIISIIVALVLRSGETRPRRRSQLTTWALGAAALVVLQLVLALLLIAAGSSTGEERGGPCVGGPEIGAAGEERPDGTTVFRCSISGTATLRFP